MIKVWKVGYELEVSKNRFPNRIIKMVAPANYYSYSRGEYQSPIVYEWQLKPVSFLNERNLIRRFLCNLLTGSIVRNGINVRRRYDFNGYKFNDIWNPPGASTNRGESGHLHISFSGIRVSNIVNSYRSLIVTLTPLMSRGIWFRDTITHRASIISYTPPSYSKRYFITNNGDCDTLEIRINESFIAPIIIPLLMLPVLNGNDECVRKLRELINGGMYGTLKDMINNRRMVDKSIRMTLAPFYRKLAENSIELLTNNPQFSQDLSRGGRYYKKVLEIFINRLDDFVNRRRRFNNLLSTDILNWFYNRSRKFRTYIHEIYLPFFNGQSISEEHQLLTSP